MKRMVLVVALIAASEAQAQYKETGSNSSNQPMSDKAVIKEGVKGSAAATHHGVRPAPTPIPVPLSNDKKKIRND
jgi:hypothetical protein